MQIVKCEKCNKDFIVKVKQRQIQNGNTQVYFECSHCKATYHCYYESPLTLSLQNQINEAHNMIMQSTVLGRNINFQENFNRRQKHIERLDNLKEKKKKELKKIN